MIKVLCIKDFYFSQRFMGGEHKIQFEKDKQYDAELIEETYDDFYLTYYKVYYDKNKYEEFQKSVISRNSEFSGDGMVWEVYPFYDYFVGLSGTSGSSGYSGHSDWFGPPRGGMGWSSTAPPELIELIKYRNDRLKDEWIKAMEHDVSGSTIEEVEQKSKELEQRVLYRFDEITKRYEKFDEIIYNISKLIDPKQGKEK